MSKKSLKDYQIESALGDIFGFPSDPDESEDGEESDEEEVSYNITKLQRILEDLDEPGLRPRSSSSPQHAFGPLSNADLSITPPTGSDGEQIERAEGHISGRGRATETARSIQTPQLGVASTSSSTARSIQSPQLGEASTSFSNADLSSTSTGSDGEHIRGIGGRISGRGRATKTARSFRSPQLGRASTSSATLSVDVEMETDGSDEDEDIWKKNLWNNIRPKPDDYDSVPMTPKRMLPSNARPVRHFEKFFTQEVFDLITTQTNLYAEQNNVVGWNQVHDKEIKAVLGIFIIMGYHILPSLDLYWSSDPAFRVDEIASTMPFKRFQQIIRCLHLNDNSKLPARATPNYDKLFKIRPLLTILNKAFQENAKNSSTQSIDESMIVFKGRSSLKQYMPMKPIKRGFKVWCRCDSYTGYLYEFEIYTGKDGDKTEDNLGAKVVLKLTDKLKGMTAVHVTFDNFFCGYELIKQLFADGIYASGTSWIHFNTR